MTPTQISHYRIASQLGAGGMGEVYLAEDTRLRRKVAIKLLPAEFAKDADRLRRFEQEARATSALNHPNILTIYDIGAESLKDGEAPYIVAELLEGEELRAQLGDGALPVRKVLDYARQIADGLAAAHTKGVVHRDLKPENLFVTSEGHIKILDFGLAKLRPRPPGGAGLNAPTQTRVTGPNVVMGTVGYMSPEQVRGQETDHRSDIFSFGVILYEMLSGRRAFHGDSAVEVMNAILKEDPPEFSETHANINPQVERIVRRCLEKKPERRFQSTSDLGFALEALSSPSSSRLETARTLPAVTDGVRTWGLFGNAQLAWILAAGLFLATLGFAWAYLARQPAADARVLRSSLLPPEKSSFEHLALSPDGRWLAFTAATGAKVQLWVRALDALKATPLAGTEGSSYPFWSPDSRFIAFFAGNKLKKVEVSGGVPATLCNARIGSGGTWSREGVILFTYLGGGGVFRVSATGGEVRPVTTADLARQESDYSDPRFLPDDRHFLYYVFGGRKEARGIYLGSLDGTVKQRLLGDATNALYATSSTGNGLLLFGREDALMAQPFDAAARKFTGESFSIAEQVSTSRGYGLNPTRNFSVSDNGVLVFDPKTKGRLNQLVWVDRGGRKTLALEGIDDAYTFKLSPDEKRVAVSRSDFQTTNDLWLANATGANLTRFTFDPASDVFPVWSPDGSHIAWSSNREGLYHLYQKAASGAGQDRLLLKSKNFMFPTDWSRDGRYLIYREIDPKTNYDVWVLPLEPLDGKQPFPVLQTEANEGAAVLSPDGQWLAYMTDESGRQEVYVQGFPGGGGKRQVSTGGGGGPQWRSDGKELYYHALDGKLMVAPVKCGASFEMGTPVDLLEFRTSGNLTAPYYAVTQDGQRFLLSTIVDTQPNAPLTVVVNWTAELKK